MQPPVTPLLVLAAFGVGAWLLVTAAIRLARRPRSPEPDPATMELRPEPPAVAGLLGNDFVVTRDALPATLLDLAARGVVAIEHHDDETFVTIGDATADATADEPAEALAHERRVLHHVRSLARSGRVPAEALTTGPSDSSRRWWGQFRKEVVAEAQRRGLCRPVWDRGVVSGLWAALAGVGVVLWASVRFDLETVEVTPLYIATLVALAVAAAAAVVIAASDRQRGTDLGRQAAAHWLGFRQHHEANDVIPTLPASAVAVRGRYLAYSAALGLAAAAVRDLPLGAEDDERAWTDYGGGWRQVRVDYPRLRPGWGRRPFTALVVGGIGTFLAANLLRLGDGMRAVTDGGAVELVGWVQRAGTIVTAVGLLALVWFAFQAVMGLLDLVTGDRQVVGRVVRARERPGFELNRPKNERGQRRFVAVDTGSGSRIAAWSVSRAIYPSCGQGREVEATVSRFLQHVRSVRQASLSSERWQSDS